MRRCTSYQLAEIQAYGELKERQESKDKRGRHFKRDSGGGTGFTPELLEAMRIAQAGKKP